MKLDKLKGWYMWQPYRQRTICFLCGVRHNCHALNPAQFGVIWEAMEWLCPTCLEIWKQENRDALVAQELMR